MKNKILFWLALAVAAPALPVIETGCSLAPSQRSAEVTTLKVLGASVDASMKVAAQLLHDGKITWPQWQKLADFHDNKFQPAYNLAVAAVQADLSSVASPDLLNLAAQLASIVASYQPTAP